MGRSIPPGSSCGPPLRVVWVSLDPAVYLSCVRTLTSYSKAIFVACLPSFAIFVRSEIVSTRRPTFTYQNSSSQGRGGISTSKRSRVRSESILLEDIEPNLENQEVHKASITSNGGVSWSEVTAQGSRM